MASKTPKNSASLLPKRDTLVLCLNVGWRAYTVTAPLEDIAVWIDAAETLSHLLTTNLPRATDPVRVLQVMAALAANGPAADLKLVPEAHQAINDFFASGRTRAAHRLLLQPQRPLSDGHQRRNHQTNTRK